jgi:Arc/MetJ family transcription regulator
MGEGEIGAKTKREAVQLALRTLLRQRQQQDIRRFRGEPALSGDLAAMRTDRRLGAQEASTC